MAKTFRFECGCELKVIDDTVSPPLLDIDVNNLPQNCPAVWDMLAKGLTTGVFQLEEYSGKNWVQKIKPRSIVELAALTALVRPGTLDSKDEKGVSLTQHYVNRKNGTEETVPLDESVRDILEETRQILCIEENTYISLANGYHKKIKDIKIGDNISSCKEESLEMINNLCDGCGFSKNDIGYEITLYNGIKVILTADHKVLTRCGWKQVSDLDIERDIIACPSKINIIKENVDSIALWLGNDESVAYLFGQILGDGCNSSGSLSLSVGEEWKADKLISWMQDKINGIILNKYFHCRSWYIGISHRELVKDKKYHHKKRKFRLLLEQYKLDLTCYNKRIPKEIFLAKDSVKLAFLAGYFDADGHVRDGLRTFCSCNIDLLLDTKQLLLTLGINTYLYPNHIHISNIDVFDKKIKPYLVLRKVDGFLQTSGTKYGVIRWHEVIDLAKEKGINIKQLMKDCGLQYKREHSKYIQYNSAIKLGINTGDIRFFRIKKIQNVGLKRFYKMSVRNTHNMIGNGVVIKNCYQEQTLELVKRLAGFTLGEADLLRRGLGKKDAEIVRGCRTKFIEGSKKVGLIDEEKANKIFDMIQSGERYSFNRCISKNTIIKRYHRGNKNLSLTVEEMYKIRNNISYAKQVGHLDLYKKWKFYKSYRYGMSLCDDKRIRPNIIKDIIYSGKQKLYRVTLENDSYIDCTENHKFPTNIGILTLNEISKDSLKVRLYFQDKYDNSKKKYNFSSLTREDLQKRKTGKVNKHYGSQNYFYTNGSYTDFKKASKNRKNACQLCLKSHRRTELHHIDGNRTNSKPENLIELCPSCHKKEEYVNGRRKIGEKGYPVLELKIKSIEYIGEDDVYDVEMEAPNHNLVVNGGIITSNSHAVAYAKTAYATAWSKNHVPLQFFLSKLENAHFKQDSFEKIADLVNEAKVFNIDVKLPSLQSMKPTFWSDGKVIYYGVSDIKGIGDSHFHKLQQMIAGLNKPVEDISFFEFVLNACKDLGESIPNKMIRAGALDYYGMPRAEMLYYLDTVKDLSDAEITEAVNIANQEKITDFLTLFKRIAKVKKDGGVAHDKRRLAVLESKIKILQNPVAQLEDVPDCICEEEENLLGAAISTHKIDGFDSSSANASCKEILCGRDDKCTLFVKITSYFPKTIKSGDNMGKEMASMIVEDDTGTLQAMVYSKEFEQFNKLLYEKACVYLEGQKQRVGNNFIVRNVWNS